uniref:Sulfatase N-terminal domain-containing protein n=1 Tax=Tetranychus urticae TaxID=32264 RepID=T1JS16_TETUR
MLCSKFKTSCLVMFIICLLESSAEIKRPNVLLIIVDDLGWNDVGFTGNKLISTPNIDTLAKEGVTLSNYYVSPICSPSRSALLTGFHPIHTGMQHDVIASDEPWGLPQQFKILPQYLKSLNYSTHLIGKWHQGFYSKRHIPTKRGFDTFNGYLSGATDYYDRITRYGSQWGLDWYENETPSASKYAFNHTTDILTSQAIKLIQSRSKNNPWFIAISYQAVHIANSPKLYQVPIDYLNRFKFIKDLTMRSYVALLASLDDSIGTIFNHLHKTGQANSTLIVFTSDNGAPTGTLTGKNCNLGVGSNQPLRGAKYTLWEGGIKGLSWIWANWLKSKGTVYNGLSHITDWTPTLFSFAGGNESSLPANIDGINLRYALEGNRKRSKIIMRNELIHNIDDIWNVSAIRIDDYKLVTGTVLDGQFDDWHLRHGLP